VLQALFKATDGSAEDVTVSVAMLEVYNESVRDLLGGLSSVGLDLSGVGPGELPSGGDSGVTCLICSTYASAWRSCIQLGPNI